MTTQLDERRSPKYIFGKNKRPLSNKCHQFWKPKQAAYEIKSSPHVPFITTFQLTQLTSSSESEALPRAVSDRGRTAVGGGLLREAAHWRHGETAEQQVHGGEQGLEQAHGAERRAAMGSEVYLVGVWTGRDDGRFGIIRSARFFPNSDFLATFGRLSLKAETLVEPRGG